MSVLKSIFCGWLTPDKIRSEVEDKTAVRDRIPQSTELHLSQATKKVLFYANEESRHLKNRHIGPEHLLLGIVREERTLTRNSRIFTGRRKNEILLDGPDIGTRDIEVQAIGVVDLERIAQIDRAKERVERVVARCIGREYAQP